MIKLQKARTPSWITTHQATKTAQYIAAPKDSKPSPWRAEEVVTALKVESHNKCIYCEGIIDDVSYSAVEHIKPKNKFEDLVLEWSNLGLVCTRCNTNKGEYWTDTVQMQLLNPYEDNVANHLNFLGPLTVARPDSTRGVHTVRKLKLSKRQDLLMSRMRRIEELDVRLRLWFEEEDLERKQVFAEDVKEAITETEEYSAVLRSYAVEFAFPVQ